MDFGDRLKELRKKSGLTQAQLAERIGVTKSVISFYEQRERSPSPSVLIKMAKVFRVSTDYLLGIERQQVIDISDLSKDQIRLVEAIIAEMRRGDGRL